MSRLVSRSVFIPAVLAISILSFAPDNSSAQTFGPAAVAQTPAQPPQPRIPGESPTIGWGIKSGLQWPSVDEVGTGLDHIGGMIGAFIDFNQRGVFGVAGDILFVNNPQSQEPGAPVGSLRLLEIPVMARLRQRIAPNNRVAVYGVAGPAFNLKLSGGDQFDSTTVDFAFGGGLEVKDVFFEARFKRGSRDKVVDGVTSSFTQQTFAIAVGFWMKP
jgi:hypothetical protein